MFTSAASQAPVPEAGKIITGSEVLNINFIRSKTLNPNSAKSGVEMGLMKSNIPYKKGGILKALEYLC